MLYEKKCIAQNWSLKLSLYNGSNKKEECETETTWINVITHLEKARGQFENCLCLLCDKFLVFFLNLRGLKKCSAWLPKSGTIPKIA